MKSEKETQKERKNVGDKIHRKKDNKTVREIKPWRSDTLERSQKRYVKRERKEECWRQIHRKKDNKTELE